MWETWVPSLGWKDPLEKGKATHFSILGLPCGSAGKEFTCNEGDLGLIPGLGRSPGERKGYPLQYSGLDNSMGLYSPWGRKVLDTTGPQGCERQVVSDSAILRTMKLELSRPEYWSG